MYELTEIVELSERAAQDLIVERLGEHVSDDLRLTGAELAGFLAAQAVLPIVCNFVSSALYERYRTIRSREHARRAREELRDAVPAEQPATDPDEARQHVVVVLVAEGVPQTVAEETARVVHERIAASLGR